MIADVVFLACIAAMAACVAAAKTGAPLALALVPVCLAVADRANRRR